MDDRELLCEYVERQSERAFADLVARHVDMVYSTALRVVRDPALAQDVAQTVFVRLARKAWTVRDGQALPAWLYRAAYLAACNVVRDENRRRRRETDAMTLSEQDVEQPAAWEHLRPLLDEAMHRLSRVEQNAVVLRFFEGKTLRETGAALGTSEDAARMRLNRAVEKLRQHFQRGGVTVAAVALATAISTHACEAAPVALAASVAQASLAGAGGAGFASALGKALYMITKTKIELTAIALVAVAAVAAVAEHQKVSQLQDELAAAHAGPPAAVAAANPAATASTTAEREAVINKILRSSKAESDMERDLMDFAAALKPGDLADLLNASRNAPHNGLTRMADRVLCGQWAKSNPAAALAWVKANDDDAAREDDLTAVFQSWAAKDTGAAFAALNQIGNPDEQSDVQTALFSWMSVHDPKGAFTLLQQLPLGRRTTDSYNAIFLAWADQDAAGASAAALKLPVSQARTTALQAVAQAWARQDPKAAVAWASALPAGVARTGALSAAVEAVAQNDPSTAASFLNNFPAGPSRDDLVQEIASNWAQKDSNAALAWADTLGAGTIRDKAVEAIVAQLGENDPASAAAALAQINIPTVLGKALPDLATAWAQRDIQGALAWVQSLPASDGSARTEAFSSVMSTWTTTDPVGAAAYIMQNLTTDPTFNALASQVASDWACADPAAAYAWALTLPDGSGQNMALQNVLTTMAAQDPQTAWSDTQQLPAGPNRNQTSAGVIVAWSAQDPATAASMVAQMDTPAIPAHIIAETGVISNWVQVDPQAAAQWVDTLPSGLPHDTATMTLIGAVGKNDPASAFNMAIAMTNPALRNLTTRSTLAQWAKSDPAGATSAVQSANITDRQRTNFLNVINNAQGTGTSPASGSAPSTASPMQMGGGGASN